MQKSAEVINAAASTKKYFSTQLPVSQSVLRQPILCTNQKTQFHLHIRNTAPLRRTACTPLLHSISSRTCNPASCPINEWRTETWVEVGSLANPPVLIGQPCWDCRCRVSTLSSWRSCFQRSSSSLLKWRLLCSVLLLPTRCHSSKPGSNYKYIDSCSQTHKFNFSCPWHMMLKI